MLMDLARISLSSSREASNYAKAFVIGNTKDKEAFEYLNLAAEKFCETATNEQKQAYVDASSTFELGSLPDNA